MHVGQPVGWPIKSPCSCRASWVCGAAKHSNHLQRWCRHHAAVPRRSTPFPCTAKGSVRPRPARPSFAKHAQIASEVEKAAGIPPTSCLARPGMKPVGGVSRSSKRRRAIAQPLRHQGRGGVDRQGRRSHDHRICQRRGRKESGTLSGLRPLCRCIQRPRASDFRQPALCQAREQTHSALACHRFAEGRVRHRPQHAAKLRAINTTLACYGVRRPDAGIYGYFGC